MLDIRLRFIFVHVEFKSVSGNDTTWGWIAEKRAMIRSWRITKFKIEREEKDLVRECEDWLEN